MGEGLEGVPMSVERMLEIPVSIVPTDAIRAMRIIGESRGWEMSRFQDSTLVHRLSLLEEHCFQLLFEVLPGNKTSAPKA